MPKNYDRMTVQELVIVVRNRDRIIDSLTRELLKSKPRKKTAYLNAEQRRARAVKAANTRRHLKELADYEQRYQGIVEGAVSG